MDPFQVAGAALGTGGSQQDPRALIMALMAQQQGGGQGMPPGMPPGMQGVPPGAMPPNMPQLPIMGAGARGGLPQPAQPVRPPMQGMPY